MTGGTGQASLLNFVAPFALTTNNGVNEPLDIEAGFGFINSSQCFTNNATQETVTGSATLNALSSGQVTGTLSMTITGAAPTSNVLTLTGTSLTGTSNYSPGVVGTLSNGVVTGTWTLTGPCTGSTTQQGNFLMCQGANKCTPPKGDTGNIKRHGTRHYHPTVPLGIVSGIPRPRAFTFVRLPTCYKVDP